MTVNQIILAAGGGDGESHNPLLPAIYDIVWSLVAFAVIGFLFWKFILPTFLKTLDERTAKIEGGIAEAEEAKKEANAAREQYAAQLETAHDEAAKIREKARADAQAEAEEIKAAAEAEKVRIIASGEQQLAAQRQQLVTELRTDVGTSAVDLAEQLVGKNLSGSAETTSTVDAFLANLDTAPIGK